MEVCLLADRTDHPVLGETLRRLEGRHSVRLLRPGEPTATLRRELAGPADLYLLKSRSAVAIALAGDLERRGARVVNRPQSTARCLDRVRMAQRLWDAGIPAPRELARGRLVDLAARIEEPGIVKSRTSRRDDLVAGVSGADEAGRLVAEWGDELVIVQERRTGDGWDYKVWGIGERVFVARRRSSLLTRAVGDRKQNYPVSDPAARRRLEELAGAVRQAFELELYGVDVLLGDDRPVVVDVNAFPGFRGVPDAPELLAAHVEAVLAQIGVRA